MANFNLGKRKKFVEDNMRYIIQILTGLMASQSTIESQCLLPYDETRTYAKGQICLYNNYLYLCKTTCTGPFEETKWEKQNDSFDELDLDTIKTFLGLTPEQLETMANLISTEIRLDKVFSSSETYTRIDNALKEAKQYCISQLAQKSTGSFKIATSTTEVTDGNYLYLIMNAVNSKYDIYALIEGTVEKLTTVDVNLDNYFTKTEIEADFLKKADADGKYATITTVDGKVDKTDIVDNLTSTNTDKPLSANQGKILNDKKLDKTDVGKITVLNANDVDIKNFILENCTERFKEYHIIVTPTCTDIPANNYFYMIVQRVGNNTFKITAKESNRTNEYVRNYRSDTAEWTKWGKVCITGSDIPKTNIAPADTTTFIDFEGNSMCNYCVKNGICFVSLWMVKVANAGRHVTGVLLPTPMSGFFGGTILIGAGDAIPHAYAYVAPDTGELKLNVTDANILLYGSFSYPVAES